MDDLLKALERLNSELAQEGVVLNLNVVGGFSLLLQNMDITIRPAHEIDSASKLAKEIEWPHLARILWHKSCRNNTSIADFLLVQSDYLKAYC